MIPISVCIITKNEAENLDKCLAALSPYPFELVVVDTGSADNSKEVAAKYTDKVFDFTWCDDFSAARNFAAECASNDFIFPIDTDEILTALNFEELQCAFSEHPKSVGHVTRLDFYEVDGDMQCITVMIERIYHKKYYHFEEPIHEQLCATSDIPYTYYETSIVIDHSGYLGSREHLLEKAERNLKLLQREVEKNPDNPYLYFQIAQSHMLMRDHERACDYMREALLRNPPPKTAWTRQLVCNFGNLLIDFRRPQEALPLLSYYEYYNDNMDYLCMIGLVLMHVGQPLKALPEFVKAITASSRDSIEPERPSYYVG
ncbi:MAG: glycosyltransferase [Ruminiclostridium sp.]|nr:glycosyltransferase [Ruminiclostridium sp.]